MAENNTTTFIIFNLTNISFFVTALLGAASNVLLLIALYKDPLKCFRNSGTYFIVNLSISDLLTCVFVPFFLHVIVIADSSAVFGLLVVSFGNVSFVSIASISVDRCLLVAYPLKHHQLIVGKVMIVWLSGIWLSGFAIPTLQMFYGDEMNDMLVVYCFSISVILLSAVMNAITFSTLKKHSKSIAQQNATDSRAQKIRILKEERVLKTIAVIACIAFFCLVPTMIYFPLNDSLKFSENSVATEVLHKLILQIFYINFAVNPLIYVSRLPNYRKTFYLIYCKRRC